MSRCPITVSEQFRLFEAALSRSATPGEVRALEVLLDHDQEAVDRFVEFTQQDVELRHAFRIGLIDLDGGAAALPSSRAASSDRRRFGHSRWRRPVAFVAALASLAACLAIAFGPLAQREAVVAESPANRVPLAPVVFTTVPPAPVATLSVLQGAKWEGRKIDDGASLSEGDQLRLVNGEARISMGSGAEITLKAPCELRIAAADRIELTLGEIAIHVAEWARGFTVETPAMEVIDLGTTFTVSTSPDAGSETTVLNGQVRVSPRLVTDDEPKSVLVSEGESLRVDFDGKRSGGINSDTLAWKSLSDLPHYRPIMLHSTGHDIDVGDEDPHWRVIAGPDDSFNGPQFAVVCVPDARYLPNDRETSQWISMANWRNASPNSVFTFQTKFDLSGFDLPTIQLFGRFLADNGVREVRVNGKAVELESWSDNIEGQKFDHPQFRTVNVTQGLVDGTNVIEVDVWNGTFFQTPHATPNPMALRVEWQAFGRMSSSAIKVTRLEPPSELRLNGRNAIGLASFDLQRYFESRQ